MLRNRRYCQGAHNCFSADDTTCKKNVTIAQPRTAPRRPNRQKAWKDSGRYAHCGSLPSDTTPIETTFLNPASVMNSYFNSAGYGAPDSQNRKQDTLAKQDKTQLSQVNNTWQPGTAFAHGYMYKSQAKLEANAGSMDRLGRLKARAIANSKTKQ